jgi:hypothetical protein
MGRISIFNGKYILPVPWKTGAYYSQARLKEFLGPEGIKAELKKSQTPLPIKEGSEDNVKTITSLPRPSNDLPKASLSGKIGSGMSDAGLTLKQLLPETVNYKWRKDEARAAKRKIRETKQERSKVNVMQFLTVKQLKTIKFQKLPKEKKLPIKKEVAPPVLTKVETIPEVPKPPKVGIGTKIYNFVNSEQYKNISKSVLTASVMLFLVGIICGLGFVFVALTMPYYIVGWQSTILVQAPINSTNSTILANITPAQPVPPSQVIKVTLPPNVIVLNNNTPPPKVIVNPPVVNTTITPPPQVNTTSTPPPPPPIVVGPPPVNSTINSTTTLVKDDIGVVHDTSDIPLQYRFQAPYSCYWALRTKGFGREFNAEYECNAMGTGLWQEACACCRIIYKDGRC